MVGSGAPRHVAWRPAVHLLHLPERQRPVAVRRLIASGLRFFGASSPGGQPQAAPAAGECQIAFPRQEDVNPVSRMAGGPGRRR
jgi:hypothetical protein